MKEIFKEHLFGRHILVCDKKFVSVDRAFGTIVALANLFGIRIRKGAQFANEELIKDVSTFMEVGLPEPFYRGFPKSVKEITPEKFLYDQYYNYAMTYGLGFFDGPSHSQFEEEFDRTVFKEGTEPKDFVIMTEVGAQAEIKKIVLAFLSGTRPLNPGQFMLVKEAIDSYGSEFMPRDIPCKRTVIELLYETKNLEFTRFMKLSDTIKLLEYIEFKRYFNENLKKLNLRNQDRKFIIKVIDNLMTIDKANTIECFEKRKIWVGLLHHIHYRPKNETGAGVVYQLRNMTNLSVYSMFENLLERQKAPSVAAEFLAEQKGVGAVLRNLNYILSRCNDRFDATCVFNAISINGGADPAILIQLLQQYSVYPEDPDKNRVFQFNKNNVLRVHRETDEEKAHRKSYVNEEIRKEAAKIIRSMLKEALKGRLDKVWISPLMDKIAVPLRMSVGENGYGVLPSGSRISIPSRKKVRAFTYWEKVNDIDLSCFGLTEDGEQMEFSWRTMGRHMLEDRKSNCILFSGDVTDGYSGGSEYFDIDLDKVHEAYPNFRYIVFCNNVFTNHGRIHFNDCFCKAGFMIRDIIDSGEVYEPKTVETSFRITGDSSFSYMFAIDLLKREMIWLNLDLNGDRAIAGNSRMDFILGSIKATEAYNVEQLYTDAAKEVVSDINDADIVVCEKTIPVKANQTLVNPWDIEKILSVLYPEK